MPAILRIKGYRFFFFSNEPRNEPAHIHVESAENYAKFSLKTVILIKSRGFNAKGINELRRIVEKHKKFFEVKWNEYFGS